jgi:hypothetical protein
MSSNLKSTLPINRIFTLKYPALPFMAYLFVYNRIQILSFMKSEEKAPRKRPYRKNTDEKQYESDADRIIHRHLMDKNDIITDEDLRSVRVGAGPVKMDDATLARFEDNEQVDRIENAIREEPNEDQGPNGKASGANPITPWDLNKE